MLKADLHIHSIHSGHAYGTIYDIIGEAKRKNMEMIAITDHGPSMQGACGPIHFYMGNRKPEVQDLTILWGCEANLVDHEGNIDLEDFVQKKLDLILLGIHPYTPFIDKGKKETTRALIKAIEKNRALKVLVHPLNYTCAYEHEPVWKTALDNGMLLELNLNYLRIYGQRDWQELKKMIDFSLKQGKKLLVNSDAHFIHEIADDSILEQFRQKLDLTGQQFMTPEEIRQWLALKP